MVSLLQGEVSGVGYILGSLNAMTATATTTRISKYSDRSNLTFISSGTCDVRRLTRASTVTFLFRIYRDVHNVLDAAVVNLSFPLFSRNPWGEDSN